MTKLTIKGKEYTFEYSIEASLQDDCVEQVTSLMYTAAKDDGEDYDQRAIKSISNIPKTAFSMFYAGLLKHHGAGRNGDKSIRSKDDAQELLLDYFDQEPDANFYEIVRDLIKCMEDDGFFKRIGLDRMGEELKASPDVKAQVQPRDHLKKGGVTR